MYRKNSGFTIVELLIVVVVIGILAAIVIVAYNGITNSAHDSAVENDLATTAKKLEIYKVKNGTYPVSAAQLTAAEIKTTQGSYSIRNNFYYRVDTSGRWYAIGAVSAGGAAYFLKSGDVVDAGGSGDISSALTTQEVRNQADADGVDGDAISVSALNGYDDSGGTGWADWAK